MDNLADALRQGMRKLASGVCIVSGLSESGERAAMTASSVTSVSNNPPSLLVCINQAARMDHVLRQSEHFCINILNSDHQGISEICSTPDMAEERFGVGSWTQHEDSGLHYISGAPAVFLCEKRQVITHGTHSIYIADVQEVVLSGDSKPILVYAGGRYHHLS